MEATVTITEVIPRDGKKPFKVMVGETEYATWDDPIGEKASQLLGQAAVIQYAEKKNGEYTNYYLNDIKPAANGAAPPATPADRPKGPVTFIADPAAEGKRITRVAIWKSTLEGNPLPEGMKATNSYLAQIAYVVSYALDNIYETKKEEGDSIPF